MKTQKEATEIVRKAMDLIPAIHDAAPDDRINTDLPLLEIDGHNIAGLLDVPGYTAEPLPIGGSWSKTNLFRYPLRYDGSIYDGSLIVGGSSVQLECLHQIELGQQITVTDMDGGRYTYRVTDIKKKKSASTEALTSVEADLVLFVRDRKKLNYTLVFCDIQ